MTAILVQGFLLSGLYALIAAGFALMFSVGRVLNLAYGAYVMLGGYAYYQASQVWGAPKGVGLVAAALSGALAGTLIYLLLVKRLKGDRVAIEIATLIVAVAMQAGIVLLFNDAPKILHPLVEGVVSIGGASATWGNIAAVIASWTILLALMLALSKTYSGRALRAASMDRKGAAISGIDLERAALAVWGLAGMLGAIAGVFFAGYTQLSPSMWVTPLIVAAAAVIVGGIGSLFGTLVIAHVIGFMEVIVTSLIAAELRGAFTMVLIIVTLLVAPKGLFGREEI